MGKEKYGDPHYGWDDTDHLETGGLFRIAVKLMMARSSSDVYVPSLLM
jgi:hypothetical protein